MTSETAGSAAWTSVPATTASRIRFRDLVVFLAISNIHYPILELLRWDFSYALLPVQLTLMLGLALLHLRLDVLRSAVPYVAFSLLYFWFLSVAGVGFPTVGAYVVVMQTATAIVLIEYLLSLRPPAARLLIGNVLRLLGAYVMGFAVLVILIRQSGDPVLFNQVAGINYVGLLTTYLILNLMRSRRVGRRGRLLSGTSLAVNLLGEQRSSFLINLVAIIRRSAVNRVAALAVAVGLLSSVYLLFGDRIDAALAPLWANAAGYLSLIPLGFADIQEVAKYAVVTPEAGYDASVLLRGFSMLYVGSEVLRHPLLPVTPSDYSYLSISHNILLEFFKVGGLGFVILSAIMLFRRYRKLFTRGYFKLDPFGVLTALVYSLLFNDLYLGFLLLPLSLNVDAASAGSGRGSAAL
jgi:hypothetical protein